MTKKIRAIPIKSRSWVELVDYKNKTLSGFKTLTALSTDLIQHSKVKGTIFMKTALFFGSFNPIHNGHLAIANYIINFTEVDELWFIVSPQNPLKDKEVLAPDYQRLEMVKRAIPFNENRMMVCDIEMSMPKPSYTTDTLKALENKYPDKEFHPIFGSDSMDTITQWKEYKCLLNEYKIFVYPRKGSNIKALANTYPVKIINAPLVDYSSTSIRQKIEQGEDLRDQIPDSVLEYIKKYRLYQTK